jgi:transcriptional regulator with XRE-family HTH domain
MDDTKRLQGQRLKLLRWVKRLTQDELAERVGLDSRHISRLETGANYPSVKSLEAIAGVLGVQLKDIFDFSQEEQVDDLRSFVVNLGQTCPEATLRQLVPLMRDFLLRQESKKR